MGFPALADAERQSPSNRLSVENASVVLAPRAQGLALALRQELSKEKNSKGTFMNNFVVYNVALELVRALRPIVAELRTHSSNIADQIERAGTSLVLNLGEGNRRAGKDRRRFFVMAQGSDASEILAALDVADAWGWIVDAQPFASSSIASARCCGASCIRACSRIARSRTR
jgi:four helix bundle protein